MYYIYKDMHITFTIFTHVKPFLEDLGIDKHSLKWRSQEDLNHIEVYGVITFYPPEN